jgi:hypothetical protein
LLKWEIDELAGIKIEGIKYSPTQPFQMEWAHLE